MMKTGTTSGTTPQHNFENITVELMLGLLNSCFPVKRVKDKKHFKRAVDIDGRIYFLPKEQYLVISTLYTKLHSLYQPQPQEINHVLKEYYGFKNDKKKS